MRGAGRIQTAIEKSAFHNFVGYNCPRIPLGLPEAAGQLASLLTALFLWDSYGFSIPVF